MKAFSKFSVIFMFTVLLAALMGCASTRTHEGTGGYINDSATTAAVKAALLNTPGVDSTEITVETFKGVVKLSGFLDSQTMINKAVQAAQGVDDVKSVTNDLTVKGQQGS
ncbi:MAG: BON domain-containing protein [Gammaproteobacteria bacterium]